MSASVCHHAPGTVIKLDISTSCIVQILDHFSICIYNILYQVCIGCVVFLRLHTVEWHCKLRKELSRRWHCLFCYCILIFKLFYELKMLYKWMLFGYADFSNQISIIDHSCFTMEWKTCLCRCMSDSIKSPHKIKMPGCTTEFTICNNMIA